MDERGDADPGDRPQKIYEGTLQNLHRASNMEADSSNRPKLSSPSILPGFNCNLTEPIPSILLTESARGGTQVDKTQGVEVSHSLVMSIKVWGPMHRP
jgi:hypothetical protein